MENIILKVLSWRFRLLIGTNEVLLYLVCKYNVHVTTSISSLDCTEFIYLVPGQKLTKLKNVVFFRHFHFQNGITSQGYVGNYYF